METQTKSKLTRTLCRNALTLQVQGSLRLFGILFFASLPVFGAAIAAGVYLSGFAPVPGVLCVLLFSSSPVVFLAQCLLALLDLRNLRRDRFTVVTDTVSLRAPGRYAYRRHTADVLLFADHGRFIPDATTFQLAAPGDRFFLVLLPGRKSPRLAYPEKMYEWAEEQREP